MFLFGLSGNVSKLIFKGAAIMLLGRKRFLVKVCGCHFISKEVFGRAFLVAEALDKSRFGRFFGGSERKRS